MVNENKSLSDLLDDQCSSVDLDSLLSDPKTTDRLYRYQTVSAILKNEYSAYASVDFCRSISAQIVDEPAILAAPASDNVKKSATSSVTVAKSTEIRRIGGGFAIAASVAMATFFSVQTLQVSQLSSVEQQTAAVEPVVSDNLVTTHEVDSLEQTELEAFNGLFLEEARRSEFGSFAPVGGEYVRTIRFSAEQWQQMLQDAVRQQAEKKAAEKAERELQ